MVSQDQFMKYPDSVKEQGSTHWECETSLPVESIPLKLHWARRKDTCFALGATIKQAYF
jgi:hypothetical protein